MMFLVEMDVGERWRNKGSLLPDHRQRFWLHFYPCALLFQMPHEANPFGIGISLFEAIPSVTKEMYSLAKYLTKKNWERQTDKGLNFYFKF
jgi:hypothetical protein